MKITRVSPFSGKTNTLEIPRLSPELFSAGEARRAKGELLQNVYPMLTADEREFIKTGITSTEWDETFSGK